MLARIRGSIMVEVEFCEGVLFFAKICKLLPEMKGVKRGRLRQGKKGKGDKITTPV